MIWLDPVVVVAIVVEIVAAAAVDYYCVDIDDDGVDGNAYADAVNYCCDVCDDVYSDADGLEYGWHDPKVASRPCLDILDNQAGLHIVVAAAAAVDKNDIDVDVYVDVAAAAAVSVVYPSYKH